MEDDLAGLHDAFTPLLEEIDYEDLARSLTIEAAHDAPPVSVFSNTFAAHAFSQAQLYHVVNAAASGQLEKGLSFGGGDGDAGRLRCCTGPSSRATPQKRATSSHRTSRSKSSTLSPRSASTPSFEFKESIRFIAWGIGGSQSLLWRYYYPNTDSIIYVIDSTDSEHLSSSLATLNRMSENALLPKYPRALPLLVFTNKQDGEGCLRLDEIKGRLIDACGGDDCTTLKRVWTLRPLVATTAQGIDEGLAWIAAQSSSSSWSDLP